MSNFFTIPDILASACGHRNQHLLTDGSKKKVEKISKEKTWMQRQLITWCSADGYELKTEHKFHPKRNWRADWAIPEKKILIEYEGLFSKKSRHTTVTGFTGDTNKYNAAQALGWIVLRFTALNYHNLVEEIIKI